MKAKSLSTFRTKLHPTDDNTVLVNYGDIIEGDSEHLRALARNRLIQILDDEPGEAREEENPPTTDGEALLSKKHRAYR